MVGSDIARIVIAGAIMFTGCGKTDRIELTRSSSMSPRPQAAQTIDAPQPAMSVSASLRTEPKLTWTKPMEWTQLAATQFRNPNFVSGATECYVSVLPKSGGGILENANRWRKQMGLTPIAQDGLDALPKIEVMGKMAVSLELDGSFLGMGEGPAKPNYCMKGALLELESSAVFIKMVGPQSEAGKEKANFDAFVQSLRNSLSPTVTQPEQKMIAAVLPSGHPPLAASNAAAASPAKMADTLPIGHPVVGAVPESTAIPLQPGDVKTRGQGLTWRVPDGWKQAPDRPMRLVTYKLGEDESSECYVTLLNDNAGGVEKNINHWLQQIGHPPKSADKIAAMPTIDVLGRSTPLIEAESTSGSGDGSARAFLGIAWISPTGSLLARLVGPATDVNANKEAFAAFCTSIARE